MPPSPPAAAKPLSKILHQEYFKSVGPRTYAAQVKEAGNGNHFIVITEGKRDKDSDQVRKNSLYLFSEDFEAFFALLDKTRQFVRDHPVPAEVQRRQQQFWSKSRDRKPASAVPAGK